MWLLGSARRCVPSPVCVIQRRWSIFCAVVVMRWWYIVLFRGCAGFFIVVGLWVPPPARTVFVSSWWWARSARNLYSSDNNKVFKSCISLVTLRNSFVSLSFVSLGTKWNLREALKGYKLWSMFSRLPQCYPEFKALCGGLRLFTLPFHRILRIPPLPQWQSIPIMQCA